MTSRTKDELTPVCRLAVRTEGTMWNAYVADNDSMDGAVLIGSIDFKVVHNNPHLRQQFIDLMREAANVVIVAVLGKRPQWKDPEPAPEHERSGHG